MRDGQGPGERSEARGTRAQEMLSPSLPRELVLASAGTGKTFRISSRIVGLLAAGAQADEIFASTFTRKAAGEILDRVIERLARATLDEEAGAELARHALPGSASADPPRRRWGLLLRRLAAHLHRLQVSTLDSFFVSAARAFSLELGIPPRWRIGDEPTLRRLESEALEEVLRSTERGEILELIRAVLSGEADRGVQGRVLDRVRDLRGLLYELDPGAAAPWAPFGDHLPFPSGAEERREAAARIDALEIPTNADGAPNRPWQKALEEASRLVEEGAWDDFVGRGIAAKVLGGEATYARKPISSDVEAAFREALALAGNDVRAEHDRRARALGTLALRFDEALDARRRRVGAYSFSDVTRRIAGVDPLVGRADLWYRLDRRARHLLLDEFQDTSLLQWEALRPLAEELLAGHLDERAAVIVADPKQSIYGWRGAEPELVDRVGRRFHLERDRLHQSFRSSRVVLEFVNRIFGNLDRSPLWEGSEEDRERVRDWLRDFDRHEPARDLPGRVRVEVGPREASMRSDDRPRMMARAGELVAELRERAPGRSVGVLLRKNRNIPLLIADLRRRGFEVSEEGGTALTDSAAVTTVLALLRLADHPGHTVARYQVSRSPLASRVGLRAHDDDAGTIEVARGVRARLVAEGYGPALDRWTRELGRRAVLGDRDLRRLVQLTELGYRWDARGATLRPGDFVRFVESERLDDPAAAGIRVMTVHQAKGLEFDVVVLPELDMGLTGGGSRTPAALPERDPDTGRVLRVFPYLKKALRPLVPEAGPAIAQARSAALRDALGILYVALTRARYALHLLVAADGTRGPSSSSTYARLIREALDAHEEGIEEGEILFEEGDRDWAGNVDGAEPGEGGAYSAREPERLEVRLGEPRSRLRSLTHRAPSELVGDREIDLASFLSLEGEEERDRVLRRGTLVHEWCRKISWLEEEPPLRVARLVEAAGEVPPALEGKTEALARSFLEWMGIPSIQETFTRRAALRWARERLAGSSGEEPALELHREIPFAVRAGDEILRGAIDRLVLARGEAGEAAARILDFKTESVDPEDPEAVREARERYAPQLRAYRRAVGRIHGLAGDRIEAVLVFLPTGVVETV